MTDSQRLYIDISGTLEAAHKGNYSVFIPRTQPDGNFYTRDEYAKFLKSFLSGRYAFFARRGGKVNTNDYFEKRFNYAVNCANDFTLTDDECYSALALLLGDERMLPENLKKYRSKLSDVR